jgi:hypothetical protein
MGVGSIQRQVHRQSLRKVRVPIPDLDEQRLTLEAHPDVEAAHFVGGELAEAAGESEPDVEWFVMVQRPSEDVTSACWCWELPYYNIRQIR